MPASNNYAYYKKSPGLRQPFNGFNPENVIAQRAPTVNDFAAPGTFWFDQASNLLYALINFSGGQAIWLLLSSGGSAGSFSSLTVTPGPASITGTTNINTTGSAVSSIGTGGTGAVHIGNATGNTAVTGSLSTTTSLSAGTTVTAGTGLTVTAGNATVTNGNVVLSTAATFIQLPGPVKIMSGAGAPSAGLATEVGDMYINTTAASATTRLYIATAASTWTNVTCAG